MIPAVSIIMPVYNGEAFIREAIDSILLQTFKDFEFIILDDGSTDNTASIILSYADSRIKYIKNEKNIGIAKTLNIGLKHARAPLIARMDSDDIAYPDRIKIQLDHLHKHPEITVCGTAIEINEQPYKLVVPPIKHEEICAHLLFECCLYHPTTVFRKNIIMSKGGYRQAFSGAEDYDLWQRLSVFPDISFFNIPEALLYYRTYSNTSERASYLAKQRTLSNEIQLNNLKRLNMEPSPSSLSCHSALANPRMVNDTPSLTNCRSWLKRIELANQITHTYSQYYLKKELNKRWISLCVYVAKLHLSKIKNRLSSFSKQANH